MVNKLQKRAKIWSEVKNSILFRSKHNGMNCDIITAFPSNFDISTHRQK
jgi:hypothetical protein